MFPDQCSCVRYRHQKRYSIIHENKRSQNAEWLEGLELDGYNEDLSIAFEYDGIQHFKFVRHFHRTKKGFRDQIERDARKDRLCGVNEVILIRVPYTVKYEDIKEYICAKCEGFGLRVVTNVPEMQKEVLRK